jgi:probable HAF family extracellular repeat protein
LGPARLTVRSNQLSAATLLRLALVATILAGFAGTRARAVTIVDFGVAGSPGGAFQQPIAINKAGDVAGVISTASGPEPFLWHNGVTTPLPTLPGATQISISGINSSDQIVGYSVGPDGLKQAVEWQNGTIAVLPAEPGFSESAAYGINDAGQIVGSVDNYPTNGTTHSVIWQNGLISDVNTTGGTAALGINNAGQVVGGQTPAILHPANNGFVWQNGSLSPVAPAGTYVTATAINNQGMIVGNQSPTFGSSTQQAVLIQNGVITDLGTNGFPTSYATAINDLGQVIGVSDANGVKPFLWQNGQMTSLQTLMPAGWQIAAVFGINDREQIVGLAQPPGSQFRDAVLITLPEPSTWALCLLAGAFVIASYTTSHRRKTDATCRTFD